MNALSSRPCTRPAGKYYLRSSIAGSAVLLALLLQAVDAPGRLVFTPLRDFSPEDYTRIPFSLEELNEPSSRYQQVYSSAGFLAVNGGGPLLIRSVIFIGDNKYGTGFGAELPKFQLLMGVTKRNPDELSTDFEANCTNGMANVYGPAKLRIDSADRFVPFVIVLQTPFRYDPRSGNLLLEIRHYQPVPPPYTRSSDIPHVLDFWNVQGDAVSRVYAFDVNATNGVADTGGLTTWFDVDFLKSPPTSISVFRQSTNLVVRWPLEAEDHILQQSPALGTGETWTSVEGTITTNGANREVVLPLDSQAAAKFYRLYLPPLQVGAGSQPLTGSTSINIP